MKAHLRGLLKNRPSGSFDRMYDTYLLDALELEEASAHMQRLLQLSCAVMSSMKLKAGGHAKLMEDMAQRLSRIHLLESFDIQTYLTESSALAAEDLYAVLTEAGVLKPNE